MPQLVLEYVFEGHKRGYNFTSPTRGFSDEILKAIWRTAMPRGQGWGADGYQGAHSLKCFVLEGGGVAISDVTVTDQRDESGRAGIRHAVIDVMPPDDYPAYLERRWESYPHAVRAHAERRLNSLRGRINDRALPKFNKEPQIIFAARYATPTNWQVVEALIVQLMRSPTAVMRRWGKVIPFTTLALDHREESRVVVLPEDRAQRITDEPIIRL
jgi:hypothetical protein